MKLKFDIHYTLIYVDRQTDGHGKALCNHVYQQKKQKSKDSFESYEIIYLISPGIKVIS